MKITVLGCSGGYPAPGGATTGYLVSFAGKNILIDMGSGVLSNLLQYISLGDIDLILLTHHHSDHVCDIPVFKYALQMNKQNGTDIHTIPVFAPSTPEAAFDLLSHDTNLVCGHIGASTILPVFGGRAYFFRTQHPVECYGIRLEYEGKVFVYTGDACYNPDLIPLLRDADLAIMDCGSLEKQRKPVMMHLTPTECHSLYRDAGIKKVVLSHLVPYYSISEIQEEADSCGIWPYEIASVHKEFEI